MLPGLPGSSEFMAAYQTALSGAPTAPAAGHAPGTLAALVKQFYGSAEFANLKPSSKATYRKVLEPIARRDGHRLVRDMPAEKARKIIEEIGTTRPGLANLSRAIMRRLMGYAIDLRLRSDNPFARVPRYKLGAHRAWTDGELAMFEARWPLGTRERRAYALLLYTAQRVGDVVRLRRSDIVGDTIVLIQQKTGAPLVITIHPELRDALKAGPTNGLQLIGDRQGRRIEVEALSALIVKAATLAGLPRDCLPHGLRKAALRRLAEHGSTTKEIAAVSGHRSLGEIERYTRDADQARLARTAIGKLPDGKRTKIG
jgi:integrase